MLNKGDIIYEFHVIVCGTKHCVQELSVYQVTQDTDRSNVMIPVIDLLTSQQYCMVYDDGIEDSEFTLTRRFNSDHTVGFVDVYGTDFDIVSAAYKHYLELYGT